MTYEGARGQTATEMQKVLHIPGDPNARRAASAAIINGLNKSSPSFTLKTANALWAEKTFTFLQDYFSVINAFYSGKVTNLDFINNAEGSRKTINTWVSNQTNNKIPELLSKDFIKDSTRLILTNAVYFKGTWVIEFDKTRTKPADFTLASGSKVSTAMMELFGPKATFNYTEDDTKQALELPYKGNRLSMYIILPKTGSWSTVENTLGPDSIQVLNKNMTTQKVVVRLPKFTFKTTYDMVNDLKTLGMPNAFSDDADLSGIDGNQDLEISKVVHQAFVDVNEEGTEAAAATAVGVSLTSVAVVQKPIPEFRADHPFIFAIVDNSNGEILFLGRVMDPTAK